MKIVFCHFLEIGASDGLDIAYFDSAKWSSRFGNGTTGALHHQGSLMMHN